MNRRLSVVVPIYNVETVLKQCLNSIYAQVEICDEVILIDDASTDTSLLICENYKKKYPSVTNVIKKKQNSGPSECRNIGTQCAKGEFIFYIDSDDWIAPNTIRMMYELAKKQGCDIVQVGFCYVYPQYILCRRKHNKSYKESEVVTRLQAMTSLVENGFVNNFIWGKLYKADIVKKYPLKTDVSMGEDAFLQHHILNEADRIGLIPIPLYYYRQVNNGLSSSFSLRHLGLLEAYEDRFIFLRYNYPDLVAAHMRAFWRLIYNYYSHSKHKDERLNDYFSRYWIMINEKYKSEFEIALRHQIEYILYKISPVSLSFYLKVKNVLQSLLFRIGYSEFDRQKIS